MTRAAASFRGEDLEFLGELLDDLLHERWPEARARVTDPRFVRVLRASQSMRLTVKEEKAQKILARGARSKKR